MATYVYEDFRVTFTPRAGDDYDVRAVDADGRTTAGTFRVPLSTADLEQAVLRLAQSATTRRATPALGASRDIGGSGDPPVLDAERLGSSLAAALLSGDVGAAYRRAVARAVHRGSEHERHGTRLTLSLAAAPALLSVPWEFLYERPRFLASQRRTPIVRLLDTGSITRPPRIRGAVRILGVVASPRDLAPLDVEAERRRITQALAPMTATGHVRLDWLEPASPRSLRMALRDGNYQVVHYVGHSDFTADGAGVIYLVDPDDGTSVEVDETLFANLLSDQDALRLVVLNSCEGARTTLTDPYAGVATTLVQLGVPAVVAMQFEISDRAAIAFAEELYTGLIGRREPIDAAVAEARKAIYSDVDRVEWATPVLFVRDPDVQLFAFEDAASTPAWWRARLRPLVIAPAVAVLAVAGTLALQGRDGEADPDPTVTTTTTPVTTTTAAGGTNAGLPFPSVSVGDEGPVVVALQHLLVEHGFDVEVSGFFDDATEDAVRALEADTNIPVDGTVGRVTWQQLAAPIRRGDQGPAVLGAEQLLALLGSPITPDARFTNRTQDLVVEFQRDSGLAVDGIVDIDTWRVLLALADERPAGAGSSAPPGPTASSAA